MKHWQKLLLSGLLCALVGAAGCVDDQPADVTPVDCTQDADCAAQEQCLQGLCEPTSQQDMGMDSILTPDTGGQDTGADLGADLPGPEDMPSRGQVGDPCDDGEDCESDYCIEAAGEGRRVCTGFCNPQDAQGCPEGYVCASVQNSGADEVFLCFPRVEILCRACEADADCGGLSDLCLDYPDGSFCGRSCALQGCPEGYSCVDIEGADGSLHSQCRADAGFCSACFDEDGDGYGTGTDCAGLDCNDQDPRVHQFATELCNNLDDDCDDQIDEDFDLQSDAQHCGACDNACAFPNASALCQGGQCVMGGCDEGRFDLDGDPANGCEYACQGSPDSPEVCDGIDNDCDGQVDEGNPGGGGGCDTGLPGVCGVGRLQCEGGALACQQQVQPSAEACDGLDNNCDGATDEGNPDGGAACATGQPGVCELGTQVCSGGALACQPNRSPSAELCNGVDDNCDGAVDDAPQGVGVACNTGQAGRCAAGTQLCSGGALACQRNQDPIVELCNGVDDNCDGAADEGNPGGGQACTTGQPGVCGPGTTACSGGAVVCNRNQEPGADTCNGLDDDCDGRADNRCPNGVSNNNNSRNLPSYGGSGGTAFTRLCGAGQMLVGVRVNSGSEVDGMAPICQQLTMSTNRGSSPFSYASAGTGAQSTGAGAGGNGGTAVSYVCPEGSFVHGFQLRTGARVDRLLVQCARASYAQGGGISLTDTDSRAFGGNGGTLRPLHRCNSNEFAAGFYGRAGSRLDNLGFACRSYTVQLNP